MSLISRKDLRRLIHPYYILNIFLAASYVGSKYFLTICSILHTSIGCELDFRESEILTFLIIVIVFRTRKYGNTSMVPYLTSACMYSKIANILLFFYSDPRMGVIYTVICLLQVVLLPEPTYEGPDYVVYFRGADLDEELEKDKRIIWLVMFYAAWNPTCVSLAPAFAELSAKYGMENLRFGKMDVGRFPETAAKYSISTSSFSQQLPTVVLFRGGKETQRRPAADKNRKIIKFFFTQENVISAFDLNNLYAECKANPLRKNKRREEEEHVKNE